MTRDYENQKHLQGHGFMLDEGYVAFTTTGTTVEIYTTLTQIWGVQLVACQAFTNTYEELYIDETVTVGKISVSGGSVTLTRAGIPLYFAGVGSTDYISSNNYVEVPIGVCPVAGTLIEAWYYNLTKNGGTPLINIGHVPTNGTGTADPDEFLANAKAEAAPANSVGKAITDFTATAVGADDLITFSTTGGSSTDPAGGWCQVKITPTLTSGLKVWYRFIGID